jgi:hypothetical protein
MSSIIVEQYSEKSIVVRGNTVPYKEKLLSIGGKWNKMLKGGEGWIFPLTKKPIVEKLLSEPPSVYDNNNENDNSNNQNDNNSSSYSKNTYKSINRKSENISEVILTKKEYLHLISRIERLEQLVAKFNDNDKQRDERDEKNEKNEKNEKPKKRSKKSNIPPLLSSINDADLYDPIDYQNNDFESDNEREPVQRLLRKKN